MPPQKTLNERVAEFRQDLDTVQDLLEQLRIEYELFFTGARKRPPFEMRSRLERLLRKWRASSIQKLELQFRLQSLNSKYNSMCEVWEKILKRREVDPKAMSPYGPTAERVAAELAQLQKERSGEVEPPAPPAPARSAPRARVPVDPEQRIRALFDQYVDAKKDLGEGVGGVSYEKFKNQIEKQSQQIRDKANCKDVEFGVVRKDGKVTLTAKPIR